MAYIVMVISISSSYGMIHSSVALFGQNVLHYTVVDLRSVSIPDLKEPFNLQRGWLLWAGIGLVGAVASIALTGVAMSTFNSEPPQREVRIELKTTEAD